MPRYATDLTGRQYGELTVLSREENDKNGPARWRCQCTCGKQKVITSSNLNSGSYTSCGCGAGRIPKLRTHGMRDTKVYNTWLGIKDRCYRQTAERYPDYGGRGITVCDRWLEAFENFYADMGDPPSDLHTIERRDNDGSYEPGNCRWALMQEQNCNKRNTVHLTLDGVTKPMAVWAKELGIPRETLKRRRQLGWSDEDILTKPIR